MCEVTAVHHRHHPSTVDHWGNPRWELCHRVSYLQSETRQTVTGTHVPNAPATQQLTEIYSSFIHQIIGSRKQTENNINTITHTNKQNHSHIWIQMTKMITTMMVSLYRAFYKPSCNWHTAVWNEAISNAKQSWAGMLKYQWHIADINRYCIGIRTSDIGFFQHIDIVLLITKIWVIFNIFLYFSQLLNYTVSQKKRDTKLLPVTSRNIDRFSKFFHC